MDNRETERWGKCVLPQSEFHVFSAQRFIFISSVSLSLFEDDITAEERLEETIADNALVANAGMGKWANLQFNDKIVFMSILTHYFKTCVAV